MLWGNDRSGSFHYKCIYFTQAGAHSEARPTTLHPSPLPNSMEYAAHGEAVSECVDPLPHCWCDDPLPIIVHY